MRIIEGNLCYLREWKKEDYIYLSTNLNNINIWNNLRDYLPYPYTEKDAKAFINLCQKKYSRGNYGDFTICTKQGKSIGGIGFIPKSDVYRKNVEIGYWLSEEYWNQGIMTDAIKIFVDYIFTNFNVIRIYAEVFDFNKGSCKILENIGFSKEGHLINNIIKNNKIYGTCVYAMHKK